MALSVNLFFIIAAVAALVVAFVAYRRTTPPLSRRVRVFLTGLRILSFLLIVFLMMDPRYIVRSERSEPANVVALIDRSESMSLPSLGWDTGSGETRFERAKEIAKSVRTDVESKGAVYSELYFSGGTLIAATDTLKADGQGTDIRGALGEAFKRYEGRNVTGFVVISDGVDTEERLVRRPVPPVPAYTVGLGDTSAPEDVRIQDVDYTSVVSAPSRSVIRAVLEYSGDRSGGAGRSKAVRIKLEENDRDVFTNDTLLTGTHGELVQDIPIEFREPGRRRFVVEVAVQGYDAEEGNNRRVIEIDAKKAGEKVLILDLAPTWELHFLTGFLRRDPSFGFDVVSAVADHPAVKGGHVIPAKDFVEELKKYDALVVMSLTGDFLGQAQAAAVEAFVRDEHRGLLVLPGPGSLFEQPAAWRRLSDLLPFQARLPLKFNLQYTTLRPGPHAASHPVTSQLVPLLGQTEWQQRSPLLGCYAPLFPKPGAEVLLETVESRAPAFVCQETGGGRVAVIAAGPMWRWKFLAEGNPVYDDVMSRLLDYLSRGRQAERFVLRSAKSVYDSGEPAVLTAEVFNEKMQPVTGIPVRAEVSRVTENGDVPLDVLSMQREGSDATAFKVSLPPLGPGRYRVTGEADLPERTIESPPLDLAVSDVSVEFQRVDQDRQNLEMIAKQTGGACVDGGEAADLASRIAVDPKIRPATSELALRTNLAVFAIVLALLSIEWIIRKRVGMV